MWCAVWYCRDAVSYIRSNRLKSGIDFLFPNRDKQQAYESNDILLRQALKIVVHVCKILFQKRVADDDDDYDDDGSENISIQHAITRDKNKTWFHLSANGDRMNASAAAHMLFVLWHRIAHRFAFVKIHSESNNQIANGNNSGRRPRVPPARRLKTTHQHGRCYWVLNCILWSVRTALLRCEWVYCIRFGGAVRPFNRF